MKKVLVVVALVMVSVIVYAFNDSGESNQGKKEVTGNGEVRTKFHNLSQSIFL